VKLKQLAIVVLLLGTGSVAMWFLTSKALPLGWVFSNESVRVGDAIAFPGCASAKTIDDSSALKLAVIRAQANLARWKNVTITGTEQSKSNNNESHYSLTVSETAEAYMRPVVIVDRQLAVIDETSQLCVLVTERP
jgi:hypothetical protein